MAIILIGFPVFGLLVGLCVCGISYAVGYGFVVPLMICIALGAALPYQSVFRGGTGSTPVFLGISALLTAIVIYLITVEQWGPALTGVIAAAAFPAYWYFKTWDPRADLDRLRGGMEQLIRDKAKRDRE